MSKSVLIIDTPECCEECQFYNSIPVMPFCMASGEETNWFFNPHKERMNNCPFIPLEKVCKMAVEASKEK